MFRDSKDARAKGDGKSDADGRGGAKPEPEMAQKAEFDTDLPQDDANNAEAPPVKSAR